jgi:16S rRNA (uracil1498-N3)-methyltransferase
MRRRFFVEAFRGGSAKLTGEAARHLGRVLRAEAGQLYELSDGQDAWLARIERVGRDAVDFALIEPLAVTGSSLHLLLLLSIIKFDRFEWCLEKATELGVDELRPVAAARSDKALVSAAAKRAKRWEKLLHESAQQARRLRPPTLHATIRASEVFTKIQGQPESLKIIFSERADAPLLRDVLKSSHAKSAVLAIGPEGGWTDEEFSAAQEAGFAQASLGGNILRTETAVIAALAALNYALGD